MTLRTDGVEQLVSVVIPCRNAADTIPECLDSLQQQSFSAFEAILVDDGSDDGTAEIIQSRARQDSRLQLLSPGRIGIVAALNLGIARARASYIARMDADDVMSPDRLKLQVGFLQDHPDISVVGCRVAAFPEKAIRAGYHEYLRWQNNCLSPAEISSNLYVESPFAHPSVMFRKREIIDAGGYLSGDFPEDYELWFRLDKRGYRMAKIPDVLLSWRESPARTSRVDPRYSRQAFDRLRAGYLARDPRVLSGRELVVWGGGRSTRMRVRHAIEAGIGLHAWVDVDPRRIGMTIWGLPVHDHHWLDREPKPFVLVYVSNHGARDEISRALEQWGYDRGKDYLAVG